MAEETQESDSEKDFPNSKEHLSLSRALWEERERLSFARILKKNSRKAWMQGETVLPRLGADEMIAGQKDFTPYEIPMWAEQFLDRERPRRPQGKVYFPCLFPSTCSYPSQLSNLSYTFNKYP